MKLLKEIWSLVTKKVNKLKAKSFPVVEETYSKKELIKTRMPIWMTPLGVMAVKGLLKKAIKEDPLFYQILLEEIEDHETIGLANLKHHIRLHEQMLERLKHDVVKKMKDEAGGNK
jgi:hypothetical protein